MPELSTPQRITMAGAIGRALLLAAMLSLGLGLYLAVLRWRGQAASIVTQTTWDRAIPFYPSWVWVYFMPYLLAPLIGVALSQRTFSWLVGRGLLAMFVSCVIFAALPTKTVRPDVEGIGEGVTGRLYRNMVTIDEPPANAAPSLHVSLTLLLAWAVVGDFPRWWPVALAVAGAVWLSTLLIWQHHLIDVGTGIVLAINVGYPGPGTARRAHAR